MPDKVHLWVREGGGGRRASIKRSMTGTDREAEMKHRSSWLFIIAMFLVSGWWWATDSHATSSAEISETYSRGIKLVESAEYPEAIELFSSLLNRCDRNLQCKAGVLFYLGRCRLELAQYQEADRFLDDAEKIYVQLGLGDPLATVWYTRARVLAAKGYYAKALDLYNKSAEVFFRSSNKRELLQVLANRSLALTNLSRHEEALRDLDRAEELVGEDRFHRISADLMNARGMVYARTQDNPRAVECYTRALEMYRQVENRQGMAAALNNLGHVHEAKSEYSDAQQKYSAALELAKKTGNPVLESVTVNNLANVNLRRGNYSQALKLYNGALDVAQRLQMKLLEAERLNNIGAAHMALADYPEALDYFSRSLELSRSIGAPEAQAWALHNLANISKEMGDLREALGYSATAVQLAKDTGNRWLQATSTLRRGNIYERCGVFPKAIQAYQEAARIQEEISDSLFRSVTLVDMANMFARRGRFTEAETNLEIALNLKMSIGVPVCDLLGQAALYYIEKPKFTDDPAYGLEQREKDLSQALRHMWKAEQEIRPHYPNDRMLLTYVKGRYFLEKEPQKAVTQFTDLASQAMASGSMRFRFLASVGLGLSLESLNELPQAESAFREAVATAEGIRKTLDPVGRKTFLHGEEILGMKHVAPYEGLARVLMKGGKPGEALNAAEFSKARSFSENLAQAGKGTSFGIDAQTVQNLEEIERRLRAKNEQLERCRSPEGDSKLASQVEHDIRQLEDRYGKLKAKTWLDYPRFYAARFGEPIPFEKAGIGTGEWVLAYDATDSGLLAFLLKGKSVVRSIFKPMSRPQLDRVIRQFRKPLEITPGLSPEGAIARLASFNLSAGRQLAKLLLEDLLPLLPQGEPVIVIPDDELGVVPFEALVLNDDGKVMTDAQIPYVVGADFFGDRNPVYYQHSITSLCLGRRQAKRVHSRNNLLVIADPVFQVSDARIKGEDAATRFARDEKSAHENPIVVAGVEDEERFLFERLPFTGELAKDLKNIYGDSCSIYTGFECTKELILKSLPTRLDQYDQLLLATHGYFGRDIPGIGEPVIVLTIVPPGTDGFLRMSEVMGLKIRAQTVAVAACQSGLGDVISGEGTMAMGRAFQYAGARSVLVSLWSVSERSSVNLFRTFFQFLKTGKSKLEALQQARALIRRDGPDHPFFWASFVLIGDVQ